MFCVLKGISWRLRPELVDYNLFRLLFIIRDTASEGSEVLGGEISDVSRSESSDDETSDFFGNN